MHHFCTYFDHRYLPRGMVMLESLHAHCPAAHIHVLCLSDECREALSRLSYPFVSLISLAELEEADPELAQTRATRSLVEYYFTVTPCLPWYILRTRAVEAITYLDADMMFFSSPEPLFEEAGDASVIITPHRFSPEIAELAVYGLYNVSWMTFRKTANGMKCLSWYRSACLEWCFDRLESDRYADQKYLDRFQGQFSGVHVMQHAGGGVAPWNLSASKLDGPETDMTINDRALIFYHAQGFKHLIGPLYTSGLLPYQACLKDPAVKRLLLLYAHAYIEAVTRVKRLLPHADFFGVRHPGSKCRDVARLIKNLCLETLRRTLLYCP